ncbi:hypothetical protein C2D64_06680 [Listeria ivanovii]|nr:hypothetical protein C2D64_06680 [Listeria ivanovii]PZG48419.1 hypothetical protein C2D66_05135 [Listeria ivanovii]PZH11829.1 hypothetical protein C2D65_06630 [Listeria ivanovii]
MLLGMLLILIALFVIKIPKKRYKEDTE